MGGWEERSAVLFEDLADLCGEEWFT